MLDISPVLYPEDLAAARVLALWGRARPRDYYDVAALHDRYGPDGLLRLAAAKDAGFTPSTFVDALRAIERLTGDDWAEDGVDPSEADRLRATFDDWRKHLAEAAT